MEKKPGHFPLLESVSDVQCCNPQSMSNPCYVAPGSSLFIWQSNIHSSSWFQNSFSIHLKNHKGWADSSELPLLLMWRQDCSLQCHCFVQKLFKSLIWYGLCLLFCEEAALAQPVHFFQDTEIASLSFSSLLRKIIICLCSILIPLLSVCLRPADMFISSSCTEPSVSESLCTNSSNLFWCSVHPVSLQFPSHFDSEVIRIMCSFTSLFYSRLTEASPATSLLKYMWLYLALFVSYIRLTTEKSDSLVLLWFL